MTKHIVKLTWTSGRTDKVTALAIMEGESAGAVEREAFGISGEWELEDGPLASMPLPDGVSVITGNVLTSGQVARLLGLSERRVRQARETMDIGKRYGRDWLYAPEDVFVIKARKGQLGRPVIED